MRHRRERELAEEIEFHRAMRERKYREQYGMSEKDAADKAKRDFGGFEKWKEVCRDVGRWQMLDEFGRDLALAVRMLRKSPLFTVVALVTLTLAIGANTAIFSLMNALMLKTLPLQDVHRLVLLLQPQAPSGYMFNYPLFKEIERQSNSILDVFAFTRRGLQLQGTEGISVVQGEFVSGRYFSALKVQPELGHWIGPSDDLPGVPHGAVTVISDRFWRIRMNGDANVLGRRLVLNRAVFTVIGVMPEWFRGMSTDERPDIFLPLATEPVIDPFNLIKSGYRAWWLQAGGRLRDGISLEQAKAFLKANTPRFFETPPEHSLLSAEPGSRGMSRLRLRFKEPLLVLMGLVLLVLLVACLNLATLLMARGASRGRELTTRFALGASRGRLLRQLLTETLLLAIGGTVLGFAVSPLLARLLVTMLSEQHDPAAAIPLDVAPDMTVFLFTACIAILATVLTGIAPALRATGRVLEVSLREGSPALRSVERRRLWPRLIMSFEVALALVLVTGASLLGYSLVQLHASPVGFDPRGLVYLGMDLAKHPINTPGMGNAYREMADEIGRLPNVAAATVALGAPIESRGIEEDLHAPGGELHHFRRSFVGPDYFRTMGARLLSGRELRWADGSPERKVVVSRSAAKLLFPAGGELGRRIVFQDGKTEAEVVGVVEDLKFAGLRDPAAPPVVYSEAAPQDALLGMSFSIVVRASGAPAPLINAAQHIVHRIVPDVPLAAAFSLEQLIDDSLTTERIMATLALFFGGLALLMTGIGLYGTLAYTTERRTGEIGIRLALGAMPKNIVSMVCAENGAIAVLGCVMGIGGAAATSKTIASFLYGVSPKDPLVFGLAALLLLGVAAGASLVPALRAAKSDPIAAIRYE
jgi:predicted permease